MTAWFQRARRGLENVVIFARRDTEAGRTSGTRRRDKITDTDLCPHDGLVWCPRCCVAAGFGIALPPSKDNLDGS